MSVSRHVTGPGLAYHPKEKHIMTVLCDEYNNDPVALEKGTPLFLFKEF